MLEERIRELAKAQEEYVIKMRRYFHEHPEVSRQEKETSEVVRSCSALSRQRREAGA